MDQNKFFYFHLLRHIFMSCYWVFTLISLCSSLFIYSIAHIFLHWISIFFPNFELPGGWTIVVVFQFHSKKWWVQEKSGCNTMIHCFWFPHRTVNQSFYDFMYLPKLPAKNCFSFYEWFKRCFSQTVAKTWELAHLQIYFLLCPHSWCLILEFSLLVQFSNIVIFDNFLQVQYIKKLHTESHRSQIGFMLLKM